MAKAIASSAVMARAKKIRFIGMDVDGVLTRGDVVVLESGEEIKFWNAKDRLIMALLRDTKDPLILAWVTGRKSAAVASAAEDLGIHHVVQRCKDKKKAVLSLLESHGLAPDQAAFVGDDLIDLPVMRMSGLAVCPADAVSDVKKYAHYAASCRGGEGVAREVCELILKAQGRWDILLKPFLS